MLNLDQLVFSVDTSQLDTAVTKVAALQTAVSKLNAPIDKATLASEKLAQAQAKTAKVQAEATVANTKAEQAVSKFVEATEKSEKATRTSMDALEKQKRILAFMDEGFSKGQASTLTMAEATGVLNERMIELQVTLKKQESLTGGNPFDKSTGGLDSLNQKLYEVSKATTLYSEGMELTKNQTRELARDHLRLTDSMQRQGATADEITAKLKQHTAEYVRVAGSVNALETAEKNKIKTDRDQINAKQALIREDQKIIDTLSTIASVEGVNNAATERLSRSVANYAQNLRTAGVTGQAYITQLDTYKKKVLEVAAVEDMQKQKYLTRAVGPQLTDIFSGLATGQQSLFTVMIQQGGQLADQFGIVGVSADKMAQVMTNALPKMIENFKVIGVALGTMFVNGMVAAGSAVTRFVSEVTGMNLVMDIAKRQLASFGEEGFKYIGMLNKLGNAFSFIAGAGVIASVAALGLMLKAMYDLGKETTAVSQANAQFGAAFGASTQEVLAFNTKLSAVGVTSSKASELFVEIAKAGGITKEMFIDVSSAANDFEKYVGGKATDAIKQFSSVIKDPIKELTEFGIQSGYVSKEQIELVKNLLESGQGLKAQEIAVGILKQGYKSMTDEAKSGMSSLDLALIEVSSSLSNLWNNFKNSETTGAVFKALWQTIAVIGSEVWFTLKAVGIEIGGIGAQIAAVLRGDFAGAKSIGEQMTQDAEAAAEAQKELVKRILEGASASSKVSAETRQQNSQELEALKRKKELNEYIATGDKDNLTRLEYQTKQVEDWNKKLGNSVMTEKEILAVRQKAGLEWDKSHKAKKGKSEAEKELEQYNKLIGDLADKSAGLNSNFSESVALINKFSKSESEREDALTRLIKLQPLYVEGLKAEADAHKANQKALDDWFVAFQKQTENNNKLIEYGKERSIQLDEETEKLAIEARMLGLSNEQRKEQLALLKAKSQYDKEINKIENSKADSSTQEKEKLNALNRYNQAVKNVNTEVANDAAEKLLEEYNRIREGISDTIVTALFEGGKAGSKKLRDFLVAELRKPITLVVNALVNTLMNSVTGGVAGSAAGAAMGGAAIGGLFGAGGLGGAMLGGAGWLTGATTLSGSLSAATSLLTSGVSGILPGLGMLAGALGPIAIGLSFLSSLDHSGTMHTGGGATYSKATGSISGKGGLLNLNDADISQAATDFAKQFTQAIGEMLDATAVTFGKSAGYEIATAFADDTSKDSSWGSLVISKNGQKVLDWKDQQTSRWAPKEFADGEAGRKEYLAAVAKDVRDTLINETPDWADTMLNALGNAPTIEGLTQVVTNINAAQSALESLGKASAEFAGLSEQATSALIEALGGASAAVSTFSSYYQNYYSEEERKLLLTNSLTSSFSDLNKQLPKSRLEFRAMVDAASKAGDSNLLAALLKLAPAFADITDAIADTAEQTIEAVKEQRDAAYANWKTVVNREKSLLEDQLRTAETSRNSIQSIFDLLSSNIRELYGEVTSTSNMLTAEGNAVIKQAIATGVLPSQTVLSNAIGSARAGITSTNFTTRFDEEKAKLELAANLKLLQEQAGEQLTADERQVTLLKDQIDQYANMLSAMQDQIDLLNGINTSLMTLAEASAALNAATGVSTGKSGTSSGPSFGAGGGSGSTNYKYKQVTSLGTAGVGYVGISDQDVISRLDSLSGIYHSFDGTGDLDGLLNAIKDAGGSLSDLSALSGYYESDWRKAAESVDVPAFASGGMHSGGLRLVGENGPELEVTGPARYFNNSQTSSMLNNSASIEALTTRLDNMSYELRATAVSTAKIAKILDDVTPNRTSVSTTAVA